MCESVSVYDCVGVYVIVCVSVCEPLHLSSACPGLPPGEAQGSPRPKALVAGVVDPYRLLCHCRGPAAAISVCFLVGNL